MKNEKWWIKPHRNGAVFLIKCVFDVVRDPSTLLGMTPKAVAVDVIRERRDGSVVPGKP